MRTLALSPTSLRSLAAALGLAVLATTVTTQARAGCGATDAAQFAPADWRSGSPAASLQHGAFLRTAYSSEYLAPIVGLWKVTFLSKGNSFAPDNAKLDEGYAAWHSDGTEIMNSGRPPISSSFCMGAWKQVGPSTFKLNHVALSWDVNGGTTFQGPTSIRELVTVAHDGDSYAGTVTIINYAIDGTTILPPGIIHGIVQATRVTAD